MKVQIVKTGFSTVPVNNLPEGSTVKEALAQADVSLDTFTLAVDGNPANLSTVLLDGQIIQMIGKVKGGL